MKKVLICLMALMASVYSWGADADTDQYNWVESTKTLTIKASGYENGIMADYATSGQPWSSHKGSVLHIIVQDGIKTIGTYAFYNCSNATDVILPASLNTVKQGAFGLCTVLAEVRFKGSPNEWASIVFQSTDSYRRSHPFYANVESKSPTSTRKFAFYYTSGSAPSSVNLEFTSAINTIQPYAFYGATNIVDVYIPGTVSSIGDYALYCAITNLYVNKKKAPSKGTNSITWKTSGTTLYVPEGATTSYKAQPFHNATSGTSTGAKNIGTSTDHTNIKSDGIASTGNTYKTSGSFDNIQWSLDSVGTLTLEGYGSVSTNYTGNNYSSVSNLPWARFRRLVNKAIIKAKGGDISALNTVLRYHYALDSIIIDQNTIPTHSYIITETNNHANDFDKLFDKRKNVTLKIKAASLADATVSNLGSDPWDNAKLDIQLSDNLVISDNADYSTILANCSTYVEKPITLQLGRTLIVDGDQYNTFCSPIALTKDQLNDADIRALESSSLDGDVLTLTFSSSSREGIEAGKPYLVKPSSELSNPTFTNIAPNSLVSTTTNTETEYVDFIGVLAPTPLTGGDHNTLFLGAGNELFWPEADGNIGGMRAYFSLKGDAQKAAKRARIVMNPEVATGVENGVLMNGENGVSHKILRDGQIIIIRDGKEYNVMGIMMK